MSVAVTSDDEEIVDVSALPLSMDDASIESVAEIAVLMVDADADDKVQFLNMLGD